jgi:hypothetical protein
MKNIWDNNTEGQGRVALSGGVMNLATYHSLPLPFSPVWPNQNACL